MVDDAAVTTALKSSVPYGLGVQVVTIDGRPALGHSGRLLGFRAVMRWLPDEGIAVAVMTNQSRTDPNLLVRDLLRSVLGVPPPCPGCAPTPLNSRCALGTVRAACPYQWTTRDGTAGGFPASLRPDHTSGLARRGSYMAIRVEVYTIGGMASGVLARPGTLREALATEPELHLERAAWQAIGDAVPRSAGSLTFATDDILFAVADEEPSGPDARSPGTTCCSTPGRIVLEGELATMPGFDPGRSLTRPSGEWVLLRDVRLSVRGHPEAGVAMGDHALVNRYGVERIRADLMLGFFFPGAAVEPARERRRRGVIAAGQRPQSSAAPAAARFRLRRRTGLRWA